jgi:surface polysaccharide O-acyltransferase-like enzyme
MNREKKYNPAVDILRIISILAVILIHTSTKSLAASAHNLQQFPIALFLNQASRFTVPLFFMISGFVLELNFHIHENYFSYLKRRINRLFIPYIFWSAIYYFFVYTNHSENFFQALLNGDASYQLYFIPAILFLYAIFPIIHKFYPFLSNKFVFSFLSILQIIILFINYYLLPLPVFYPLAIVFLNYFIFFFGIFASRHIDEIMSIFKKWRYLVFAYAIFFAFYIFFEGKNLYLKTHNYLYFYTSWRPSVLLYTISLSACLYYVCNKNLIPIRIVKACSRLSFFVFFIHVIILEITWNGFLKNIFFQSQNYYGKVWFDLFSFIIVAGISFILAFVAHKIPHLSKITG